MHLYYLFEKYVFTSFFIYELTNKSTNKKRSNISFAFLVLPCFNEFCELFNINETKTILKKY